MLKKRNSCILMILFLAAAVFVPTRPVLAANQVVSNCGDNGKASQLRAKITAANASGGGTITFTCGPSITLQGSVLPAITTDITIDGDNKVAISGNNASRIFYVNNGATLTLNNITITRGYNNGDGGAIYSQGTLNINHSKFLDNHTTTSGSGGAIVSYGPLQIIESEFANNSGANGGALYPRHGNAVTIISLCNFHDNRTTSTTAGWGGAILIWEGASVTISSTTFNLNEAREGGALYVHFDAEPTVINNTTLTKNTAATYGGGIYNEGTLNMTNSTLDGNKSTFSGGGILNFGTLTLTDATLNDNEAGGDGGAITNPGTATLTRVTLSNNKAEDGGGIEQFKGSLTAINSTFSGNSATNRGGGLKTDDSDTWFSNVTFSGNSAPDGGGIYRKASSEVIKNSLFVKGANGSNCNGTFFSSSFNLSDDNSCGFGAGDNVANLNLGSLKKNGGFTKTHLPLAGSAAIDSAQCTDFNGTPVTKDQRNISRAQGLGCDVGAVERCPNKPTKPDLVSPQNGKKAKGPQVALDWDDAHCAAKFNVVVRLGSPAGTIVYSKNKLFTSNARTSALIKAQTYFWQVTALGDAGKTKSDWQSFRVK